MIRQNKCLQTSFINDAYEKKRLNLWNNGILGHGARGYWMWAVGFGFWIFGLSYLLLLFGSYHTSTLEIVYPPLDIIFIQLRKLTERE